MADLVEDQAEGSRFPDRARRLARDMRLRATEIELGAGAVEEVAEFADNVEQLRKLASC